MKIGIEGYFRLQVFKADGTFTGKDTGWIHNLITDQGLDALATEDDVMVWYTVGTGSAAPAVTDTWVGAFVASSDTTISDINGVVGTSYGYRRKKVRFGVGVAEGNLQECAVGWSSSTGTAFMHELVRDGVGAAISITVLANEYLEFTYELRYNIPAGDFTGVGAIDGVNYDYTMRAASCSSTYWWSARIGKQIKPDVGVNLHYAYTGNIGAITTVPSGQSGTATVNISVDTYNPGDYHREFTVTADTTQWNVAGGIIRSLTFGCTANRWQGEWATVGELQLENNSGPLLNEDGSDVFLELNGAGIAKSGANTLSMVYRLSWTRA